MRECIKSHIENGDELAKHLEITVDVSEDGYGKASMPLKPQHFNSAGVAHGGAIFALADVAFAAASNACLGPAMLNAQSSISYLRATSKGPMVAEAKALREGKSLSTYEVQVFDGDHRLVATCTITGFRTKMPLPDLRALDGMKGRA